MENDHPNGGPPDATRGADSGPGVNPLAIGNGRVAPVPGPANGQFPAPATAPPEPSISPSNLEDRYHLYSIQLFAEAMTLMSRVLLQPREISPRNELINTLHSLISALSRQPRRVVAEHERLVRLRALELLTVADESVNGPDTTEGRAKLYQMVTELKAL